MLTAPGCGMCDAMHRLLGDRVTAVPAVNRPDLLALSGLETVPQYVVMSDGGEFCGAFAGMMPVSLWERRVSAYTRR
jgi:hypothetical protein